MGLDQYVYAKYKDCDDRKSTGACGGLFPLAPKNDGKEEIGYWRKAYDINDYIIGTVIAADEEDVNCKDLRLSMSKCEEILEHAEYMVKEGIEFEKDCEPEELEWHKQDWTDLVNCMKTAIRLIKEKKARIYYYIWY